jgi:hypothetical protein
LRIGDCVLLFSSFRFIHTSFIARVHQGRIWQSRIRERGLKPATGVWPIFRCLPEVQPNVSLEFHVSAAGCRRTQNVVNYFNGDNPLLTKEGRLAPKALPGWSLIPSIGCERPPRLRRWRRFPSFVRRGMSAIRLFTKWPNSRPLLRKEGNAVDCDMVKSFTPSQTAATVGRRELDPSNPFDERLSERFFGSEDAGKP